MEKTVPYCADDEDVYGNVDIKQITLAKQHWRASLYGAFQVAAGRLTSQRRSQGRPSLAGEFLQR